MTPRVDLAFRLAATLAPLDHGYALFGAICRALGDLHGAGWLAVHPLDGAPRSDGLLAVDVRRGLRMRVDPAQIPRVLPLAGQALGMGKHVLRVGGPAVQALQPAGALGARMVVIKGFTEAEGFREAARRQLDALQVAGRIEVGRRRVLRVGEETVVGFGVAVHELDPEGSLRVQFRGLGGRQRMGCGVLVPLRSRGA